MVQAQRKGRRYRDSMSNKGNMLKELGEGKDQKQVVRCDKE